MMKVRVLLALALTLAVGAVLADCERVPSEIVRALGTKRGKPISTGLVFIDGKYVKPPYRVTRSGSQILLNEHPVTGQLVPWKKFLETQPPSKIKTTEVEIPADESAPAEKAAPETDGVDPAAPKDGGNAAPKADESSSSKDDLFSNVRVTIVETRVAADAEDLEDFNPNPDGPMKLSDIPADSKEDKDRQKRAEEAKKEEAEEESAEPEEKTGDAANVSGTDENGDEVDPASPEGEAVAKAKAEAEKKAKPAVRTRTVCTLEGPFEENARSRKLLQPIDNYRGLLEQALKSGGFIFFGTDPARKYCKRQKGSFASKDLLKKLPELMSRAKECEAFCDAVRSAGLFSYINQQIAEDLFRHKTDYFELKQRRKALEEEDKLNTMMNSHGR